MIEPQDLENYVQSALRRGLSAARAGDYGEARRWFRAAVDADRDNITALLWLAWLAPSRRERLTLLSRVLVLEPENERAQAAIRWARGRPSTMEYTAGDPASGEGGIDDGQPSAKLPADVPLLPGRADLLRNTLHSPQAKENARSGIAAQRARKLLGPLGLLLIIATSLLMIGVALMAWHSPSAVLAWMLPTATPIPTSTLTPSPTPTAALLNAVTSTPAPSPTAPPALPPLPQPTSLPTPATEPHPASASGEKWIDVDLTQQRLTAYQGDTPVYEAIVSTGLPNTPTVVGQFRIYWKLSATDMSGPSYYLRDVPFTMYFHGGYALHGTYWHSNFGQPMSHGCVNLRTEDAEWLFNWADPPLPAGASRVRSSNANPGTLVVVHH